MKTIGLKDFKLLGEDDHHYTIAHPQGKSIQICKSGLKPLAHQFISKLKKNYDEGGEISPTDNLEDLIGPQQSQEESLESQIPPEAPNSSTQNDGGAAASPVANVSPTQVSSKDADAHSETTGPMPASDTSTPTTSDSTDPMLSTTGMEQAKNAIQGGIDAEKRIGDVQAQAYKDMPKAPTAEEIFNKYQAKDAEFAKALPSIDKDRYWKNMSTGSKITTAIALVLGSLGAMGTGRNSAVSIINNEIDKDIDAQKNEQGKQMNLWKMNRDLMGSDMAANLATQNQYLNIVKSKIMQAAGENAGPLAQAKAAETLMQFNQQMAMNNRALSLLDQQKQGLLQDPSVLVPILVKDPGERKKVFQEIDQAKNATQNEKEILQQFDKAAQENTVLRTGAGLLRTPASILRMDALFLPMIHDAEGRVNEFEQKTLKDLAPAPGDSDSKIRQKREGLQAFINQKRAASTAKAYGIDLGRYQATAPVPQYKIMNNSKYQKVPGGWQKVQ